LGNLLGMGWFKDKFSYSNVSLKEKIAEAKYQIDVQREKLTQTSAKLERRNRELFDKCVKAEVSKNNDYAIIYANECVEIRKMAKLILNSEVMLERVSLRLETIEEFGDVIEQIAPINSILRETKGQLVGIIPSVAKNLDEVHNLLTSTMPESSDLDIKKPVCEPSEETNKIFEEASIVAEQKLSERFPELPIPVAEPKRHLVPEAEAECSSQPNVIIINSENALVEQAVYEYVRTCCGELNMEKCASDLHLSPEIVKAVIEKLAEEGKLRVQ